MKRLFNVTKRGTGEFVSGPYDTKNLAKIERMALNKRIEVTDESALAEYVKNGHSVRKVGESKWEVEIITHVVSPAEDHWRAA